MWDVFICHASEDKEAVARPLADALTQHGLKVWFDEFSLTLGDSLRRSIDRGLAESRYGVVILSHSFFAKEWPQNELDGLAARETGGVKVILPVWHGVTREDVVQYSPLLADRLAVPTDRGLDIVVREIMKAISPTASPDHRGTGRATIVDRVEETGTRLPPALRRTIYIPSPTNSEASPVPMDTRERPVGLQEFRIRQVSTSSNIPHYTEGYVEIHISSPATLFSISAVAWHPQVYVGPLDHLVQIPGGGKATLKLRVQWANGDSSPQALVDSLGRKFPRERPRDPGQGWEPLYITFEGEDGASWAAVTYFKVTRHQKGFPEVSLIPAHAPMGWVRGH